MKAHLTLRVRPGAVLSFGNVPEPGSATAFGLNVPHWSRFIREKAGAVVSLSAALDRAFAAEGLPFWVTREYEPGTPGCWSRDETEAELHRVFRLILQRDAQLPARLIERVRSSAEFETVRPIAVEGSRFPERAAAQSQNFFDQSRARIGLQQAHLFGRGHPEIKVAILDTGVDRDHPELQGRVVASADFVDLEGLDTSEFIGDTLQADAEADDEIGHGSHVAGIISGAGRGMPRGVAPECSLIAVRTLATLRSDGGLAGAGIVDNINVALKWAVDQGAHVINASLGIRHVGGGLPHEEVVRYALSRGVTVVAASGNDGTSEKYYPGALPGVIAVGASDEQGEVAPFTSYGAAVALLAPGTSIMSCDASGGYQLASGTSQAAPFVAGAAALLRAHAAARGVALGDNEVKAILRHTSDRPDRALRTARSGYGVLNVADACHLLQLTLDELGASGFRPGRPAASRATSYRSPRRHETPTALTA